MNRASPPPRRRRRPPQELPAPGQILSEDLSQERPSPGQISQEQLRQERPSSQWLSPEPPAPQRRPARIPRLPQSPPPRDAFPQEGPSRRAARARAGSPLGSMPLPVRLALILLCAVVFVLSVAGITRDYLARQEERRRMEAEAAERAQHPLYYGDLIARYAAQQGVDPALVSAIILCESSFNPQAESSLGARGLMQLMEDTAGWIAHKLGEDGAGYSFDLLYDPETNVRFGSWYLGYLSRRFSGDATKIVCAYHAGQGNVDSWLSNPAYSADGVTLDVIPTADTAAYAARVLRARDVYRKYYFSEETAIPSLD